MDACAEDWPMWRRDPTRTAVTSEKLELPLKRAWHFRSRLSHVAPKNLPVRVERLRRFGGSWRERLPEHSRHSLAIIAVGDSLYFTGHDGRAVCLDAETGQIRWEFLTGGAITCAPCFYDDKIYFGSDDGYVYCLIAASGKLAWKHKPVTKDRWFISFGRMSSIWPIRTDVLVDEGVAYFGAGVFPHDGMFVNAIDAASGKRWWRSACYGYGFAGHIFSTKKTLILPTEFKGFHGYQLKYRRSDGSIGSGELDLDVAPHRELLQGRGGVVSEGIRYTCQNDHLMAWKVKGEHAKGGRKPIWGRRLTGMVLDPRDTIFAGGVVYYAANEYVQTGPNQPATGTGGAIIALDPKDGKKLWATKLPERPHHMAIADGRLFVSTRQGSIYCYGSPNAKEYGAIDEPVRSEIFPAGKLPEIRLHAHLVRTLQAWKHPAGAEVKVARDGFAIVLDCKSGMLAYQLAHLGKMSVCAVFDAAADAVEARKKFSSANLHGSRISVWHRIPGSKLPFPPNFADLIVSEAASLGRTMPRYTAEMERLLKPIRGVGAIGGKVDAKTVKNWAVAAGVDWSVYSKENLHWAMKVRPAMKDSGGWTHANGDAGNTMCSHDSALKPPLGIVWYGPPYASVMFARPPLVKNGVVVCRVDRDTLEGYDQYNGRFLWRYTDPGKGKRDPVMDLANAATGGDRLFIPPGNTRRKAVSPGVIRLDLWTGRITKKYPAPVANMRAGQFAVSSDGKTFWCTGHGDHSTKEDDWTLMAAVDADTGRQLWRIRGTGSDKPSWNAIADGRMYALLGEAPPALRETLVVKVRAYLKANDPTRLETYDTSPRRYRRLTARDTATGKVLYQVAVDVAGCDQYVAASKGHVIFATHEGKKWWQGWPRKNSLAVHDGATGRFLWKKPANYRFMPIITDKTVYAEPWAYDLATGKQRQRAHPVTGEKGDWSWVRSNKQCGGSSGSTHFLFGRNKGFGYHDALRDCGMYTSWHHRQACTPDTASGGGMMIKPPYNTGCGCPWSMPFTMAMAQMPDEPAIPFEYFHTGNSTPARHLRVNFGSCGDRRDRHGNVWLQPRRRNGRQELHVQFDAPSVYYPGGDGSRWGTDGSGRRSVSDVSAKDTDLPFVFDSLAYGLKRFSVPITSAADGKGVFTIRLGFSALPGDQLGQRVFDVRLNGKTVLEKFDVIKEAEEANRALWKEFTLSLDGDLVLDLVAVTDQPAPKQFPIICGMEVISKKMVTLGYAGPKNLWLGNAKPKTEAKLQFANFRDRPFKGRLVVESTKNIAVSLPDRGAIQLLPATRKNVDIQLQAVGTASVGRRRLTVRLVSDSGTVELERAMYVDALGTRHRKIISTTAVYRMHPDGHKAWITRVQPPHYAGQLPVSSGTKAPGDKGACYAYLAFGIPRDVGRIHHARVQLHVASNLGAIHQALFGRVGFRADPRPANYWGALRRLKGPPWPDLNQVKFESRPAMLPGRFALSPIENDLALVETNVPSDVSRNNNGDGSMRFAIEPTTLRGATYWSNYGWHQDPARAPRLVIDYEPTPPKAK